MNIDKNKYDQFQMSQHKLETMTRPCTNHTFAWPQTWIPKKTITMPWIKHLSGWPPNVKHKKNMKIPSTTYMAEPMLSNTNRRQKQINHHFSGLNHSPQKIITQTVDNDNPMDQSLLCLITIFTIQTEDNYKVLLSTSLPDLTR